MITPDVLENYRNPAFVEAYRTWLQNPVTVRILQLAKSSARPIGLPSATGEAALYYSGQIDAIESMLTFLSEFDSLCKRHLEAAAASSVRLESTYGVPKLDEKAGKKS
jgi:hypothetical protein